MTLLMSPCSGCHTVRFTAPKLLRSGCHTVRFTAPKLLRSGCHTVRFTAPKLLRSGCHTVRFTAPKLLRRDDLRPAVYFLRISSVIFGSLAENCVLSFSVFQSVSSKRVNLHPINGSGILSNLWSFPLIQVFLIISNWNTLALFCKIRGSARVSVNEKQRQC